MKRYIALLIIAVLCVTSVSCKDDSGGKDPDTLTYWCSFPSYAEGHIDNLGEVIMYEEMEKITGVHMEFQHPPEGKDEEKFNLLMSDGMENLPDIIEYEWTAYPGGPDMAINDGVIIDLSDLISKHAPNIKKIIEENPDCKKAVTSDSGKIFAFPILNVGNYRTFGGLIIRKDWLDDLGLETPVTIDDWEAVLRAFKNKKGAKAPLTLTSEHFTGKNIFHFNGAFDVGISEYIDNGVYKYPYLEDGYREYLELMNRWFVEGLLDTEFDNNSSSVVDAKMTSGQSGATYGFIGSTMGKYMNEKKNDTSSYSVCATPFPVLNAGEKSRFAECQREARGTAAITTNCEDPVTAVKWLDFFYGEEGDRLKNFGVEGVTYEIKDGKCIYTDFILNNPEGLSISVAMAKSFRANVPSIGFNQNPDYLSQYYPFDEQKEALELWSEYTQSASKIQVPPISYTIGEAEEIRMIKNKLDDYVADMTVKFIRGEESFENYPAFISKLEEMGLQRYIEIKQTAYDRYCAK